MECNKDEAIRAKSIAESKLVQKDFSGAKKFALKAQTLYPGLDGISQMLSTLDVYACSENKLNGEVDWYGVLGVHPSADDQTIKKQYRKLALMLHPDKNNSVGADGAFKLISEAWRLLSDKAKRLAYNQRRGTKEFQQKVPTHAGGQSAPSRPSQQKVPTRTGRPSAPSMQSESCNFARRTTSAPKSRSAKVPSKPTPPTPAPSHQRTDSFWTTCRQCNAQFEYVKIYRNCTLLCHHCRKPFLAVETAPPAQFSKSAKPFPGQRRKRKHGA